MTEKEVSIMAWYNFVAVCSSPIRSNKISLKIKYIRYVPRFECLLTRSNHSRLGITNSAEEMQKVIESITTDGSQFIASATQCVNFTVPGLRPDRKIIFIYHCLVTFALDHCSKLRARERGIDLAFALPARRWHPCRPLRSYAADIRAVLSVVVLYESHDHQHQMWLLWMRWRRIGTC